MCCWRSILRKPPLKWVPTEGADLLCNTHKCLLQLFAAAIPSLLHFPLDHSIFHAKQSVSPVFPYKLFDLLSKSQLNTGSTIFLLKRRFLQIHQGPLLNKTNRWRIDQMKLLIQLLFPPICLCGSESISIARLGNKTGEMDILHDRLPCSDFL